MYDMGRTAIDLSGQTFGSWTVIGRAEAPTTKEARWRMRCSCGAESETTGGALRRGRSVMCKACRGRTLRTHHLSESPEYKIWLGMKQRCGNQNSPSWPRYGGRGVTVDPRWVDSFETFLKDIGPRPSPSHSVDRVDNAGPYSPENCRWATRREQALNTRRNVRWTHDGRTMTISEWGQELGIDSNTLRERVVKCRWSVAKALTTPV